MLSGIYTEKNQGLERNQGTFLAICQLFVKI